MLSYVFVLILALGSCGTAAQSTLAWLGTGPETAEGDLKLETAETGTVDISPTPDPSKFPDASPHLETTKAPGGLPSSIPWGDRAATPDSTQDDGALSPPLVRAVPGSPRAAVSALQAPVTDIDTLCVCNLLVAQCDVNCCCDPDCTASDFSVFSACSVPVVMNDEQLCTQRVARYSMDMTKAIPERVVQLTDQVNPNIFCIYSTNYGPALTFSNPEIPTESNFDSLVLKFGANSFTPSRSTLSQTSGTDRYEYGTPIQTSDSFLAFPTSLMSSQCTDQNPAGFLLNQDVKCSRNINVENCTIPALTLSTYYNVSILEAPKSSQTVPVSVQSIFVTSIDGTFNQVTLTFPEPEYNPDTGVCTNVVLKVKYFITYTVEGLIKNAAVSFVLGAINRSMVPVQQDFQIRFTQQNTSPVPLSGNPGYVVGQPIVAGFKPAGSGIIQSTDRYGQLTMMQSSSHQDCLAVEGKRSPVLFGYNMVSGCKLRYSTNCQLTSDTITQVLRGQNFPDYVASFGNSQAENVADWVTINQISTSQEGCQVPISLEIVVSWKKYGSLVNPQAKIDSVTAKTTYASLKEGNIYQISSLVTFVDISAPAQPGYKAQPTIDAKLPFDFFYPFV
ncbi:tectonic-1 [Lissotriton helveticus]